MESSDGVDPEIIFSPVKKRRYEQYRSECWVFSHKSESEDSLGGGGGGTVKSLCRVK